MKYFACLAVAAAAFVVSLCSPVGAEDLLPDNGSISLTNRSSQPITIDIVGMDAVTVLRYGAVTLPPKKTVKAKRLGRLTDYDLVFDATGDFVADAVITLNLDGTKSYKGTIGDFGLISILPE